MCGIIAIVRRVSDRRPPEAAEVTALVTPWAHRLRSVVDDHQLLGVLRLAGDDLLAANQLLLGVPGVVSLLGSRELPSALFAAMGAITDAINEIESHLETRSTLSSTELEPVNAALVRVKDATWAIERDRLRTAPAVDALAGRGAGMAALDPGIAKLLR